MGDKNNWKTGLGLAAGIFAATAASASDTQNIDPQAMDDIKGLISYMATDMPVVRNQSSTVEQEQSIGTIARPLNNLLDGCYGETTIADYAIALHIGLQTAVRTHTAALYISNAEQPFRELTGHIQDAAQWIPHIGEAFATTHPEAQDFMNYLDYNGIIAHTDTHMTLHAVISHNYPETGTYAINNVHIAPLQYFGPYSSMQAIPEFAQKIDMMADAAAKNDHTEFWRNAPYIPQTTLDCK